MPLHPALAAPSHDDAIAPHPPAQTRGFTIHTADSLEHRSDAARLIRQRYRWRGYRAVHLPAEQRRQRCTLTASSRQTVLGTITVGLDGPDGLNCESLFAAEVQSLREAGLRLCEFTRLAVDAAAAESRQVLAALFHAAYLVAYRIGGFDRLLIEVHPRHARYYERMFGAGEVGTERHHPGVDAPAVLLSVALADVARRLSRLADECRAASHSLFALAFSPQEEALHLTRLAPGGAPFTAPAAARARSAPGWRS